jgi:hypothetical protein
MAKVCILNATTNIVENVCIVDDVNNVPSFLIGEGQVLATDHTGEIDDVWDGSSYTTPTPPDNRTDEEKWADIRSKRNELLAKTDFYALSDVTMSTEMTTYRQALRDIPSTQSDPDNITWPTKP